MKRNFDLLLSHESQEDFLPFLENKESQSAEYDKQQKSDVYPGVTLVNEKTLAE